MIERILKAIVGFDPSQVPEGAKTHLEWARMPVSGEGILGLIVLVLAVIALIAWNYRAEGNASFARKTLLCALRLAALLLVALLALEPRLAVDIERTTSAHTVVMIDESLSMTIEDRYEEQPKAADALAAAAGLEGGRAALPKHPRSDLAREVLNRADVLAKLDESNPVRIYAFSDTVRRLGRDELVRLAIAWKKSPPAEDDPERARYERLKAIIEATAEEDLAARIAELDEEAVLRVPAIAPKGTATDVARALRAALEEAGSDVLAAVVLVTDGRSNSGEDPAAAADLLRKRNIPVYPIAVGDPADPRNLALLELGAPPRAYKGDPMLLEARVRVRGFDVAADPVEVELLKNDEVIETRVLPPGEESIRFRHTPEEAGEIVFTARIAVRPGELSEEDNERAVRVEVVDEKARVLLIASSPSNEFRTLRTLLRRDRTIETSIWLQSADPELASHLSDKPISAVPGEREELFEYDAVILIDPDPNGLPVAFAESLRVLVLERGSGVLLVAGNKFTIDLLEDADMEPLRTLLPIEPDIERAESWVGSGRQFVETWPLQLSDDGAEHPITRLGTNTGIVLEAWRELPGIRWHFPVLREKPGASVLLRHSDPAASAGGDGGGAPLLSAHHYGPGRTLFAAFDETWRWRGVAMPLYERYWVQAIRFIVEGRLLGGRGRVTVRLDREVCNLGETVGVRATVLDESYRPYLTGQVEAEIVRAGGIGEAETLTLTAATGVAGRYEATFVPPRAGLYDVVVRPPGGSGVGTGADETWKPGRASVRVEPPDFEFADPRLDAGTLAAIADRTGGQVIPLHEAAKLPDLIGPLRETVVIAGNPVPLWDTPFVALLLVAVLGIEWFIRKRSRMV